MASYHPNYFSMEDILATQERVPCKFEVPLYGLGYLDPSAASKDLEAGTKLELPCWMAKSLSTSKKSIVTPELPTVFKEKYRDILLADPSVVDLHKLSPHFYELGLHTLPMTKSATEVTQISKLLTEVLRERLRFIMDSSLNCLVDDGSRHSSRLDELERGLFEVGQASLRDHERWLKRKTHVLRRSSMIEAGRKRKIADIS